MKNFKNLAGIAALLLILMVAFSIKPAQAETKTNHLIEQSPFMIEFFNHGQGNSDMTRFYDSEANVVCYIGSSSQGRVSCLKPGNDNLAHKYRTYREAIDKRKALESQLGNN